MALFSENSRSKFESTAYTVLLLAFFFAVGLAGGVLYRLLPTTTGGEVAVQTPRPQANAAAVVAPALSIAKTSPASEAVATAPVVTAKPAAKPLAEAAPAPAPPATTKVAAAKADPAPAAAPAAEASAAMPAGVAPIPSAAPAMMAVAPVSASVSVDMPPPTKATPDLPAVRPVATLKPAPATPAKAAPEKRVAAASKEPPSRQAAADNAPGSVRVQFGAYTIEDNAHETQWAVEATGLPVEVTQETTRKGHVLYYVRSQPFADRTAALSAAAAAQQKAKNFVNPVAIDYMIVSAAGQPTQQAQAAAH